MKLIKLSFLLPLAFAFASITNGQVVQKNELPKALYVDLRPAGISTELVNGTDMRIFVINDGNKTAAPSTTRVTLKKFSTTTELTIPVGNLEPKKFAYIYVPLNTGLDSLTVCVAVDALKVIKETNENNNMKCYPMPAQKP